MKRLIDILFAGPLLVAGLPFCLPIMLLLALTGEGEIFYAQKRIGYRGREFELLKFATMVKDSPSMGTGTVTVPDDPRVLPVGRVLRKTKINELPQLWNVLRGDMTLVGPRPLAEQDFVCYDAETRAAIVTVRPGLTGVGSIVFRDEEAALADSALDPVRAYREEIAPRKGELERWYVRNHSPLLDLRLLVVTGLVVLFPTARFPFRLIPELPMQ